MKCNDCGYRHVPNTSGICPNCGYKNSTSGELVGCLGVILVVGFIITSIDSCFESCLGRSFIYEKGARDKDWSEFLGKYNWQDADAKCKSMDMRIPTMVELREAQKREITKKWKTNGTNYWSSDTSENNRYFLLNVNNGNFSDIYEYPVYNLRCIKN